MSKPVDHSTRGSVDQRPHQSEKKPINFWQNVIVGSTSAMAAVSLIQPMIYFKNIKQSKTDKPVFEKNPRVWYRGALGFAASFAPTIAIQTSANGVFSSLFSPIYAAILAGISSALVVCPAEGIMIQQQKTGQNFWKTANHIRSNYGITAFYNALIPTMIREGTFTAAYLGLVPILKEKFKEMGINDLASQFLAGATAGIIGAPISHPFDTYKTQRQRDFSMKEPMRKALFKKGAFAGFGWRVGMVITATTVMPFTQEKLNKTIENFKK